MKKSVAASMLTLIAMTTAGQALTSAAPAQPASPAHIFLAFSSPTPSDPADPCRTGSTFKYNNIGDEDELTVCTFDAAGNPAPTDASTHHLEWSSAPTQSEDPPATRFRPDLPPPEETTGAAATAVAYIQAVQGGRDIVAVALIDETGSLVDSASIEKAVQGGGCAPARYGAQEPVARRPMTQCRQVPTALRARAGRRAVRGRAHSEPECVGGRGVTLFRRLRGPDNIIGEDTTDASGRWRVVTGRLQGRYYARVAQTNATDAETGSTVDCLPDQSNVVRGG